MKKQEKNHSENNMPKNNPFSIPEGYFENLAGKIEEKINEKQDVNKKFISFWSTARNQLALAAGFILFVLISYAVMHFIIDGNTGKRVSGLQYADIIESDIQDFETDLLIEAYIETRKDDEVFSNDIPDEEMIDYLISEDVDIEMIVDEF